MSISNRIGLLFGLLVLVSFGFISAVAPDGVVWEYEVPDWMQRVAVEYFLFGLMGMFVSICWPTRAKNEIQPIKLKEGSLHESSK